jgi:Tat protein secretion system quality control protein TatD with DNase activity
MGLSRRALLASALAVPFARPAFAGVRPPLPGFATQPGADAYGLPLVDFHTHLQRRLDAADLVARMDRAKVSRLVLMALYYGDNQGTVNDGEGSDEQALRFARAYPGRFVPFVGMQRDEFGNVSRWQQGDRVAERMLIDTESKLASLNYFGMGEFMFRFYPYQTSLGINATSDMKFPPDSWLFDQFAKLSARFKAPLVFHCEAEPEFAAQVIRVIERHPQAVFVWSHNCGRQSAAAVDALMARYPNLYADLGAMMYTGGEGYGSYWPRRTEWMHLIADAHGFLRPEMKALFERRPDRFVLGTDSAHARVYQFYGDRVSRWRFFLDQISPAAQIAIAYGNAERLFAA